MAAVVRESAKEADSVVRLFIGGLQPDVSADMVEGRFKPFGSVNNVDLRPAKLSSGLQGSRGFGYVDFKPKDDKALSRCLSLYNGCTWKGKKMRLEKAKPDYLIKMQMEKAIDVEKEQEQEEQKQEEAELKMNSQIRSIFDSTNAESMMLRIEERQSKISSVPLVPKHTPLEHKKYFPPMKSNLTEASLCWDPLEHEYTRREIIQIAAVQGSSGFKLPADSDDDGGDGGVTEGVASGDGNQHGQASAQLHAPKTSFVHSLVSAEHATGSLAADEVLSETQALQEQNRAELGTRSIKTDESDMVEMLPDGSGLLEKVSSAMPSNSTDGGQAAPFKVKQTDKKQHKGNTSKGKGLQEMQQGTAKPSAKQIKQSKQHSGALLKKRPLPPAPMDYHSSSDSEDYSAMKKAAAMKRKRKDQQAESADKDKYGTFEVVSDVFSASSALARNRSGAPKQNSVFKTRVLKHQRRSNDREAGQLHHMDGIDDSWLASVAMR